MKPPKIQAEKTYSVHEIASRWTTYDHFTKHLPKPALDFFNNAMDMVEAYVESGELKYLGTAKWSGTMPPWREYDITGDSLMVFESEMFGADSGVNEASEQNNHASFGYGDSRPIWNSEGEYSRRDVAAAWDAFFLSQLDLYIQSEKKEYARLRLIEQYIDKLEKRKILIPKQRDKLEKVTGGDFAEVRIDFDGDGSWNGRRIDERQDKEKTVSCSYYTKQNIELAEDSLFLSSDNHTGDSGVQVLPPIFDKPAMLGTKAFKELNPKQRSIAVRLMEEINSARGVGKLKDLQVSNLKMNHSALNDAGIDLAYLRTVVPEVPKADSTFADYASTAVRAIKAAYEELEINKRKGAFSDLLCAAT